MSTLASSAILFFRWGKIHVTWNLPQQYLRVKISPHFCQHLLFSTPSPMIILVVVMTLMTNDWWHWSSCYVFFWPLVCRLWRNDYSSPLPIFKLDFYLLLSIRVLYILWVLDLYRVCVCNLQIFFPFYGLSCHSLNGVPCIKVFNFNETELIYFFFRYLQLGCDM